MTCVRPCRSPARRSFTHVLGSSCAASSTSGYASSKNVFVISGIESCPLISNQVILRESSMNSIYPRSCRRGLSPSQRDCDSQSTKKVFNKCFRSFRTSLYVYTLNLSGCISLHAEDCSFKSVSIKRSFKLCLHANLYVKFKSLCNYAQLDSPVFVLYQYS